MDDQSLDTKAEADQTPAKEWRRWQLEIKLALKREKKWRMIGDDILNLYRGKSKRKNSFNILWANTETLRPAIYNSPPKPDVRRRFRQKDILGKAVSEVMERSLSYCTDAYDLDSCLQNDTLDSLLQGRGLSRVRYVPKIDTVESEEGFEGEREEVEYEQALCEHVQWDDFITGPGKTWEEVQWVGFRQRVCKEDLEEMFGEEVAKEIRLDDVGDTDVQNKAIGTDLQEVFKRAELWEIWDKDGEKVFFVNESYKKGLLYATPENDEGEKGEGEKGDPPLKLKNFYPVPRPLQMVEDTSTLVPTPLYELYRQQAEELDRISARINKIIDACRVRFVHDSTLTELKGLMDAGDNEGIPTESARAYMQAGGLDKAIWFMPVQHIAAVLTQLYIARDACKQVIYEITGISDVIRGQTDPNETLGAQQLKANSSSLRLQRMQREVQRYSRDLIRLLAEVIGENFDPQTLAQMTGLQFPTAEQKQMIQMQMQAMQQQQPPPPEMQAMQNAITMPTWEDIMGVLKSDMQREYRVDIETDSTVAQTLAQDMQGLQEVLTGLVQFWEGVGPAVERGALSIEAVKAVTMTIIRRARMGLEVEDAIESGMQQPKPEADPNAGKAEEAQAKAQADMQMEQGRMQMEQQKEAAIAQREAEKMQMEQQAKQQDMQAQMAMEDQKRQHESQMHQHELAQKDQFERWKAELDAATKIMVAQISAKASLDAAAQTAQQGAAQELDAAAKGDGEKAQLTDLHGQTLEALRSMMATMSAPKEIVRGPDGRAVGLKVVGNG